MHIIFALYFFCQAYPQYSGYQPAYNGGMPMGPMNPGTIQNLEKLLFVVAHNSNVYSGVSVSSFYSVIII